MAVFWRCWALIWCAPVRLLCRNRVQVAVAGFNDVKDEHGPFYDDCVLLDSEGCRNFDIIFDPDPTHHRLFAALHVLCGALSALYLATIPSGHRNC